MVRASSKGARFPSPARLAGGAGLHPSVSHHGKRRCPPGRAARARHLLRQPGGALARPERYLLRMKAQLLAVATAAAWGFGGYFEKKGLISGGLAPQVGATLRTLVALVVLAAVSGPALRQLTTAKPGALLAIAIGDGVAPVRRRGGGADRRPEAHSARPLRHGVDPGGRRHPRQPLGSLSRRAAQPSGSNTCSMARSKSRAIEKASGRLGS